MIRSGRVTSATFWSTPRRSRAPNWTRLSRPSAAAPVCHGVRPLAPRSPRLSPTTVKPTEESASRSACDPHAELPPTRPYLHMTQGSDFGSNSADIEAFIIGLMGPIPCKDVQVVSPVEDFNSCIECTTPDGVGKSNSCRIVANGVADTKKSCFAYGGPSLGGGAKLEF
mmetsp:Transcript_24850/g.53849  ORF Transcript_24850/g.53849 Transcript_24850/m.53849 type:complete len:169 (+) Transcript_24850:682-1188(+)